MDSGFTDVYARKYELLKQKYDHIELSNEKLRNRLYHTKKEIIFFKQLKRILVSKLAVHGDRYADICLEIPENEPGANIHDHVIDEVVSSAQFPPSLSTDARNSKRKSTAVRAASPKRNRSDTKKNVVVQISSPVDLSNNSSLHSAANPSEAAPSCGAVESPINPTVVSESDRAVSEIVESVSADFVQKQLKEEESAVEQDTSDNPGLDLNTLIRVELL